MEAEEALSRIETIGDCTLYLGDCRNILPTLAKVDAVVTDPPYGTHVTDWDVSIDEGTIAAILDAAETYAVFFYSNTRLMHILSAIRACGRDAWVAVWHKPNAVGFERRFAPQWVPVVIAYRGSPPFWGKDLCACPIVVQDIDHPTPKQVGITEWLVLQTRGQSILDPFMGSGTTAVACVNLGRKFIGIEIEPRYFDIACRRVEDAYKQPRLFVEPQQPLQQPLLI